MTYLHATVWSSACALTLVVSAAAGQDKSVNDGAYSAAQAERGQTAFERNCTNCHDTARFTGAEFVQNWSGKPLSSLFEVVRTTMPEDNPGSLKPQQYADIVSFLLQLNGYPAGETELPAGAAALKSIQMEPRKPSP
jgi:mono/diheme cytochrome c family protein